MNNEFKLGEVVTVHSHALLEEGTYASVDSPLEEGQYLLRYYLTNPSSGYKGIGTVYARPEQLRSVSNEVSNALVPKASALIPRIAITGESRAGKSLVASILANKYGYTTHSFGDALRRTVRNLFEGTEVYDEFGKNRHLLNAVGQGMRELYEDVWVDKVANSVYTTLMLSQTRGIVIDDLRQPNEEAWLKENGFFIVRIRASDELRRSRSEVLSDGDEDLTVVNPVDYHVDNIAADYEIINDGILYDDLERKVDEVVADVVSRLEGRKLGGMENE